MTAAITDYPRVADRAVELGCRVPDGIAILPANFASAAVREDLVFGSEAATVRKLFRTNDISLDNLLPNGERVPSIHNKHSEWALLLFISFGVMSQNPHVVAVALGIISNYATEFFKGMPKHKVKLNIVVEKRNQDCKMIEYEGDTAGLTSLPEIVRSLSDE
jgi:hypothetical protein